MQQYPAGDGWGAAGLAVTNAGRVYRFTRPVCKVLIKVAAGQPTVFVGVNESLSSVGVVENEIEGAPAVETDRVAAITAAEALAKGVPVAAGESLIYEFPIDPTHGRRGIWCMWFVVATTASAVTGGVVGM